MNVTSGDRAQVTFFFIWKLTDTVAFAAGLYLSVTIVIRLSSPECILSQFAVKRPVSIPGLDPYS
jgi:hypothetical protein